MFACSVQTPHAGPIRSTQFICGGGSVAPLYKTMPSELLAPAAARPIMYIIMAFCQVHASLVTCWIGIHTCTPQAFK